MGQLIQLPVRHDQLVSKKQLARMYQVSPRTIERRVQEGLPSEIIEGCRYFRLQAAKRWMEERCHEGAAVAAR